MVPCFCFFIGVPKLDMDFFCGPPCVLIPTAGGVYSNFLLYSFNLLVFLRRVIQEIRSFVLGSCCICQILYLSCFYFVMSWIWRLN